MNISVVNTVEKWGVSLKNMATGEQQQGNDLIAQILGWERRFSHAVKEQRWYSPDGFNYLLPPDYLSDTLTLEQFRNSVTEEDWQKIQEIIQKSS